MKDRILVAGVGNVFLGDDGFGVEVARRLKRRVLPPSVWVEDFGIRGRDLTYALMDGVRAAILVDAMPRGGAPGTLYFIEPRFDEAGPAVLTDPHALHPAAVLSAVRRMGGGVGLVRVLGCEPSPLDEDTLLEGLSPPVAAAVEPAIEMVERVVDELLRNRSEVCFA